MTNEGALRRLLDELAEFGRANDARETERSRRLMNIAPETGVLLGILVRATDARRILEIGTGNGYSTIWLGWAASDTGGHVTTIERDPNKVAVAQENFRRAGLSERITICPEPAVDALGKLDGPFDLMFLDADRPSYLVYLDLLLARLRPGGLLITDNVVSHAKDLTEFLRRVKTERSVESITLPVGNGHELTYRHRQG